MDPHARIRSLPTEGALSGFGRPSATEVKAAPASDEGRAGARAIDAAAFSKLRWRCRRGLLENDLLLERLFNRATPPTQAEASGLYLLMELGDNDLLDLFLGRQKPTANLDRPEVHQVLAAVRAQGTRPDLHLSSATSSRTSP